MQWIATALPPGPGIIETFNFVRNPFRFMDDCARRYGDWFTVRVPGVSPFVFTSDPAAVREVFLGDPEQLHAGKANRPLGAFMGEKSVLFLDGAAHLHDRRLILPAFQGERMKAYGAMMRAIAREAIARFPIGETFPIHPRMRSITFDVIMRAVFGLDDSADAARLKEAIRRFFAVSTGRFGALLQLACLANRPRTVESVGPRRAASIARSRRYCSRSSRAVARRIAPVARIPRTSSRCCCSRATRPARR